MTLERFLRELQELLQRDLPIAADTYLWDMAEWDSLAIMAVMAWFSTTFGIQTKFSQYKNLDTPKDLAALTGGAIVD